MKVDHHGRAIVDCLESAEDYLEAAEHHPAFQDLSFTHREVIRVARAGLYQIIRTQHQNPA